MIISEMLYEFIQCLSIFFAILIGQKNSQSIYRQDEAWAEGLKSVREHLKMIDDKLFFNKEK